MLTAKKPSVEARLKRLTGQIQGIQKMVGEGRYCVDILTQIAAARSALDAIGVELITDHMEHCVAGCASAHPEARKKSRDELVTEMKLTLGRFLR